MLSQFDKPTRARNINLAYKTCSLIGSFNVADMMCSLCFLFCFVFISIGCLTLRRIRAQMQIFQNFQQHTHRANISISVHIFDSVIAMTLNAIRQNSS